ncbi:hypothetical protein PVK06_048494 [Gossypium arboreum]|uniref:Retrovirus-related Pol polyprotein from transposon TNT 1-94 n=1 Tax=Gossypium arboreum TaxID=29729 RepID=A0ABR0MGL4_GOSAR|nr:hypothetical protein PVK06_048494 [Gossypium arboreum]
MTFREGKKGQIHGKGTLNVPRMHRLKNVQLVNDLETNIVSINQLCDQGMLVNFTKNKCIVSNDSNEVIIEGGHTFDNYCNVMLVVNCNSAKLWYKMFELKKSKLAKTLMPINEKQYVDVDEVPTPRPLTEA